MTSKSQRSSPIALSESSYDVNPPPIIYGSLRQFLEELDRDMKKEKEKSEKFNSGERELKNKEFKKIELYEKGSLLDFFSQGLGLRESKISQQQNPAPLKHPPQNHKTPSNLFRQNDQNSQNPILDFLGKCLPRQPQKPSTHPTHPLIQRYNAKIVR
jgi:hypothetical protein